MKNVFTEVAKRGIVLQVAIKDLHAPAPKKEAPTPVESMTFAERHQLDQIRKNNTTNLKEIER